MATVKLKAPFAEVNGSLEKQGIVHRRKHFRDDKGKVVFEGKQEVYAVKHPRDYRIKPPQGTELQTINRFRIAQFQTSAILHSADYTQSELEQMSPTQREEILSLQSQRADYYARYLKQLGSTPDPLAPIDRTTRQKKHYRSLNTFIRALILKELSA